MRPLLINPTNDQVHLAGDVDITADAVLSGLHRFQRGADPLAGAEIRVRINFQQQQAYRAQPVGGNLVSRKRQQRDWIMRKRIG